MREANVQVLGYVLEVRVLRKPSMRIARNAYLKARHVHAPDALRGATLIADNPPEMAEEQRRTIWIHEVVSRGIRIPLRKADERLYQMQLWYVTPIR